MKLNHKDIIVQQYSSEKIENDIILFLKEQKTVLVVNKTAAAILDAITAAAKEMRDITTEEISHLICELYSLGEERFKEICKDVESTIDIFFEASLLTLAKNNCITKE